MHIKKDFLFVYKLRTIQFTWFTISSDPQVSLKSDLQSAVLGEDQVTIYYDHTASSQINFSTKKLKKTDDLRMIGQDWTHFSRDDYFCNQN